MNKLNIYKRIWKVEMTRTVQEVRGRLTDDAADEGVSALLHGDEGGVFTTPFAPATHRQLRLQPGVLGLQVREVLVAVLLHVYLQHNNQLSVLHSVEESCRITTITHAQHSSQSYNIYWTPEFTYLTFRGNNVIYPL